MIRCVAIAALAACSYNASFSDCAISCANAGCPDGLACGAEGLCRLPGQTQTCTMILGDAGTDTPPASCHGLAPICGPTASDDCCSTAQPIPGGTYYRSYDVANDGLFPDTSHPATVSAFRLDKYEVTVGRFRAFVATGGGTQASPPIAGAGAHAKIPGSGWDASWNSVLVADVATLSAALQCDTQYQTWTAAPGANEGLPINCVTWYEAEAFCAWDGGYLPTEAEWNFVAAGGDEQRAYPWSTPASSMTVDCSHANYDVNGTTYCVPGISGAVATMNRVGSESATGDGKWGQSDLAGNAWEWVLDWYAPYIDPCNDCANLAPSGHRSTRGGNFSHSEQYIRTASRYLSAFDNSVPSSRTRDVGFRCARP